MASSTRPERAVAEAVEVPAEGAGDPAEDGAAPVAGGEAPVAGGEAAAAARGSWIPVTRSRIDVPASTESLGFQQLGLRPELLQSLGALGYEEPTPVQRAAIPPLLAGRDVVAQAATGTGKTAAFALPVLQRLDPGPTRALGATALVVVPTRELALQVSEAIHTYGRILGASVLAIYGGQPLAAQVQRLRRGAHVIVATPGRALDHLRRRTLSLERVRTVVLDEADEMLDLGFAEDLEAILAALPGDRQTALFSATLPPRIAAIASRHLRDPVRVRVEPREAAPGSVPRIRQLAIVVPRGAKEIALGRLLDVEAPKSALVFCRTRLEAARVAELLASHGQDVAELHGGLSQEQRDQVVRRLKARQLRLVVATDVAARGLDVSDLSHVINFDPPSSPEVYVHRIGRTGRAGREGKAITILEPRELRLLKAIERLTGQPIELGEPPSLSQLRDRRLTETRGALEEARLGEIPDGVRTLAEQLASAAGPEEALAAAVAALHRRLHPPRAGDEAEIPIFRPPQRPERPRAAPRPERPHAAAPRPERPQARHAGPGPGRPSEVVRLFVGLGRTAGLRPADLVGAIANEAGLGPKEIGAIAISERHATVEVPAARATKVIEALRATTIRGRKVRVDRDRSIAAPSGLAESQPVKRQAPR